MTSAVRRYDKFQMDEVGAESTPQGPVLRGAHDLVQAPARPDGPLILNLTDDRPLREFEYSRLTTQVFMPRLTALLPPTPRLVADTWPIPARAIQSLVGEMPSPEDYDMTGTLVEVRKAGAGPALTAVIGISGQMNLPSYRRQLAQCTDSALFSTRSRPFRQRRLRGRLARSSDTPASKSGRRPEEGIVNARGYISRVLMAWKATNLLPDEEARLKQTRTYELQMERRLAPPTNDAGGGPKEALTIPVPLPTATEANSWLLYQDPMERFHLLHPQELALNAGMSDLNNIHLVDQDQGQGKDAFILKLNPAVQDPQAERKFRDVGEFQRAIADHWAKLKLETLPGPAGWLPEADWAPLKVYRKELAVKTTNAEEGGVGLSESTLTTTWCSPKATNASRWRAGRYGTTTSPSVPSPRASSRASISASGTHRPKPPQPHRRLPRRRQRTDRDSTAIQERDSNLGCKSGVGDEKRHSLPAGRALRSPAGSIGANRD